MSPSSSKRSSAVQYSQWCSLRLINSNLPLISAFLVAPPWNSKRSLLRRIQSDIPLISLNSLPLVQLVISSFGKAGRQYSMVYLLARARNAWMRMCSTSSTTAAYLYGAALSTTGMHGWSRILHQHCRAQAHQHQHRTTGAESFAIDGRTAPATAGAVSSSTGDCGAKNGTIADRWNTCSIVVVRKKQHNRDVPSSPSKRSARMFHRRQRTALQLNLLYYYRWPRVPQLQPTESKWDTNLFLDCCRYVHRDDDLLLPVPACLPACLS